MITHGMKVRRQLRSARVSALSLEERRQELREAEKRAARGHSRGESAASPRSSGTAGAAGNPDAGVERPGVDRVD